MTWNTSLVDGPITVPVYGPEDPETLERPVIGTVEGYHLNVARSALPSTAAPYEIAPEPTTPVRLFAGDARGEDGRYALTALLFFADEAEAIAALPDLWTAPPPEEGGEG